MNSRQLQAKFVEIGNFVGLQDLDTGCLRQKETHLSSLKKNLISQIYPFNYVYHGQDKSPKLFFARQCNFKPQRNLIFGTMNQVDFWPIRLKYCSKSLQFAAIGGNFFFAENASLSCIYHDYGKTIFLDLQNNQWWDIQICYFILNGFIKKNLIFINCITEQKLKSSSCHILHVWHTIQMLIFGTDPLQGSPSSYPSHCLKIYQTDLRADVWYKVRVCRPVNFSKYF